MISTTMTWHPMIIDLLGFPVANRYVAVRIDNDRKTCITADGSHKVKYTEAFTSYLEHEKQIVDALKAVSSTTGVFLVFDFLYNRVKFTDYPFDLICSEENALLDKTLKPQSLINEGAGQALTQHWLENVNYRQRVFVEDNGDQTGVLLHFNQWREKRIAVG